MKPPVLGLILSILVLTGAALRVAQLNDAVSRTPDERVYTDDARRVALGGLREFPVLVAEYHEDSRLWIYPPPTRVGEIAVVAATMKISGLDDESAGSRVSCAASIASLAILAVMAARILPPWAAIYATACLAISLPALVIAFRCWGDALMEFLGLLMVWATCELCHGSRKWWKYGALVAAGSASVLVKESGAVIYLGCALYLLAMLAREQAWREMFSLVFAGLVGAALAVCCLSAAAGGAASVLKVWKHVGQGLSINDYGTQYQSGPWLQFFHAFWILTPVNLVLTAIAISVAVACSRPKELRLLSWIAVLLTMSVLLTPISQNFRYLSPIYGCMYLLGGMGLWVLLERAGRFSTTLLLVAGMLVLAMGFRDYEVLRRVYIGVELQDLPVRMVLEELTLI